MDLKETALRYNQHIFCLYMFYFESEHSFYFLGFQFEYFCLSAVKYYMTSVIHQNGNLYSESSSWNASLSISFNSHPVYYIFIFPLWALRHWKSFYIASALAVETSVQLRSPLRCWNLEQFMCLPESWPTSLCGPCDMK